jgi:hypothetical protein
MIGALAALAAMPLSAEAQFRTGDINTRRLPPSVGGVILGQEQQTRDNDRNRKSDHIPRGHLPPKGMCRIWIDGVPPGQQPAPTDCQTAVATRPANARVIWGDQSAFPGKGKGKHKDKAKDQRRDTGGIFGIDRDRDRDDDDDFQKRGKKDKADRGLSAKRGKKG